MIYILDVMGNNIRSQELPAVCTFSAKWLLAYSFVDFLTDLIAEIN